MHIGIEHGDTLETLAQCLRSHGRIVDVTEATGRVEAGVMARGPAQGVGGRCAIKDVTRCGDGALG